MKRKKFKLYRLKDTERKIDKIDKKYKEIVLERIKIIRFFEKYGEEATREAFLVARSTVFLWKKKLMEKGYHPSALIPGSRAPIRRRQKEWHPEIVKYIIKRRWESPRLGQGPLKKEVDEFCKERGIKPISASTIARIIRYLKDKGKILNPKAKVSFYAKTGKVVIREKKKKKKLRRKGYNPSKPGELVQMDSLFVFADGIKRYIFTAIDLKTRFAFAYAYKSLKSDNAKDFMEKLRKVTPFEIKAIQTDNGSEFSGNFEKYLEKLKIIHFYNYPRDPQSNAYVERFNRTLEEHYVEWYADTITHLEKFNYNLVKYLLWYNTKKPHKALGHDPPLKYFIENWIKNKYNKYKSNMLWDSTVI